MGLVLGVSQRAKADSNKDILIALHTLRHWRDKFCPTATIHEPEMVAEITGKGPDNFSLQDKDWHDTILDSWGWITTPTGSQGIVNKADQLEVKTLMGSRKYNDTTQAVALRLFTFFAQDWEEKNNLLPPRARRWWYKHNDDKEPAPKTRKRTLEQIEGQRKKRKQLATEAAAARQTMADSSGMLQACLQLLPVPHAHNDPIYPKIPNAPWACEACTYSPNTGENCELCTSPRDQAQPQQHRSDKVEHYRPLLFKGNPWECSACKHHLNESDSCDKCGKPKGQAMIDSSEMLQACLQLLPAPDPLDPKIPDTHWTCEACTYSPNEGENCELCTSPRYHDQPQHRNDKAKRCRPLQFEGNP